MRRTVAALAAVLVWSVPSSTWLSAQHARPEPPSLENVLRRMGEYVAAYGERASLIVATEKYTQTLSAASAGRTFRPRQLVAELALVRTADEGDWIGFRDVVEVDGQRVTDRDDRLRRVLTEPAGSLTEARRIADESSRFNVGPVIRNFNVPTTALFFLSAQNQPRFTFTHKGEKTIEGVRAWEIAFRETKTPTLVRTRAGQDVPCEGTVWVAPEDGTIVRTRLQLRGFADAMSMGDGRGASTIRPPSNVPDTVSVPPPQQAPSSSPSPGGTTPPGQGTPTPPATGTPGTGNTGGAGGSSGSTGGSTNTRAWDGGSTPSTEQRVSRFRGGMDLDSPGVPVLVRLESSATIEVTYRRSGEFGMWLPGKMSETYTGVIPRTGREPLLGEARTLATYSNFKQFATSAKMVDPPPKP